MRRIIHIIILLLPLCICTGARAQAVDSDGDSVHFEVSPLEVDTLSSEHTLLVREGIRLENPPIRPQVVIDTVTPKLDSLYRLHVEKMLQCQVMQDSLKASNDSLLSLVALQRSRLSQLRTLRDSIIVSNATLQQELQNKNRLLQDQVDALRAKELLFNEKEQVYRDAVSNSNIDKAKLEGEISAKNLSIDAKSREIEYLQKDLDAKENTLKIQTANYQALSLEKERYRNLVDSLRTAIVAANVENIKKQEENKYLAQKAKDAEARAKANEDRINEATGRKRKVRPIQGLAMRFFRTPDWEVRLEPVMLEDGSKDYNRIIRNKNAGNIEFDFVTGASVMLWDLTKYFNHAESDTVTRRIPEIRRFDQQFSYDLGVHVAFGGTNLFKNFYVGPSFRFVDFFYLTVGVNICEYEVLDGIEVGGILDKNQNLDNVIAKSWLVKPFVSFSIDLDFLSYIKK